MIVVLTILSLGLLGVIIYFAISPKSSRILKISAIAALSVIGISLLVCGILIIRGPSQDPAAVPFPVLADTPAPARKNNLADIIILAVMLLIVGFVIILAIRQKPKKAEAVKKPSGAPAFQDGEDLDIDLGDAPEKKENDDSFDIEIG